MKRTATAAPAPDNGRNNNRHIVRRQGKEISVHVGAYNILATLEMLQRHPSRLITVEELTYLHFGRVSTALTQIVRARLWRAPNTLLDEGTLSFIRYHDDWPHKIVGIKLFNAANASDVRFFAIWRKRVQDRKEFTDAKLEIIDDLYRRDMRGRRAA